MTIQELHNKYDDDVIQMCINGYFVPNQEFNQDMMTLMAWYPDMSMVDFQDMVSEELFKLSELEKQPVLDAILEKGK